MKECVTMELKDTIELMTSDNYQDRFKAEYQQLCIRLKKLDDTLEQYKYGALSFEPKCSYEILYEQLIYMKNYKYSLELRAEIEGIDLRENDDQ